MELKLEKQFMQQERKGRRGNIKVGDQEVKTIRDKISYKKMKYATSIYDLCFRGKTAMDKCVPYPKLPERQNSTVDTDKGHISAVVPEDLANSIFWNLQKQKLNSSAISKKSH